MDCKDIDALLDSHRAGAQSAAGKAAVAAHVEQCHRCADAWLGHAALAADSVAAPRPGFADEVIAAAVTGAVTVPHRVRRSAALVPVLGMAATALIALAFAWLWLPAGSTPGTAAPMAVEALGDGGAGVGGGDAGMRGGESAESRPGVLLGNTPRPAPVLPGLTAGVHYRLLASPAPTTAAADRVEVCEFFMFGCVHCYNFETMLTAWAESRAESVDLVRVPALFNDLARLHAQAFYTAEVLGQLDRLMGPFYAEIHERGQSLASVAEIRALFVRYGVDGARFDATFNSAPVLDRLRYADELNRLYRVDATPSLGINGRYLSNASMAGSYEGLLELVDALVATEQAAAEPCTGRDRACELRSDPPPELRRPF